MAHAQKPDLVFRWKGRVHLNWRGVSVQSTAGSWVCASAVVTMGTRSSVVVWSGLKGTGYPLYSPVSPSFPLPCVTVCHQVSAGLYQPNLHNLLYRLCTEKYFHIQRKLKTALLVLKKNNGVCDRSLHMRKWRPAVLLCPHSARVGTREDQIRRLVPTLLHVTGSILEMFQGPKSCFCSHKQELFLGLWGKLLALWRIKSSEMLCHVDC